MTKRILVLGATGATGKLVVETALDAGLRVTATARDTDRIDISHPDLRPVQIDLMNGDSMDAALEGVDAVISTLGVGNDPKTLLNPPALYTDGHQALIDAMQRSGVDRLVCISALWTRSNDYGPLWLRMGPVMALTRVYAQMRSMERMLAAHPTLRYTAVRAGYLQDDAINSAPAKAWPDRPPSDHWLTRRADLAQFMLDCVTHDDWVRACPCFTQQTDGRNLRP